MNKQRGFTIVELLIVIVVIGILAALVLNAFFESQKRARNTQRVTAARAYKNIINSYVILNGTYPYIGSACLGRLEATNLCWGVDGGSHSEEPNATLDSNLKTISPNLPEVNQTPIRSNGYIKAYIGPGYAWNTVRYVDGVLTLLTIDYWLEGQDQDCGMTVLKNVGYSNGQSHYTISTDQKYTNSDSMMTFCSATVLDRNNL